jgi:soluble P-type ATPase
LTGTRRGHAPAAKAGIRLEVPGFGTLTVRHLVLDYNGTLAVDGKLVRGVRALIRRLAGLVEVHVVTADTFGGARAELDGLPCRVTVLPEEGQDFAKRDYVRELGPDETVCVGNGRNDSLMVQEAVIGIVLILREGAAAATVRNADIVCGSAVDALSLLLNPKRLVATLRS